MAKPAEKFRAVAAQFPTGDGGVRVGVSMSLEMANILIGVLRLTGGLPGRSTANPRDYTDDLLDALTAAVPQGYVLFDQPWRKFCETEGATFVHPVGHAAKERERRTRTRMGR